MLHLKDDQVFGHVNESICNKNMINSSADFGKCSLKRWEMFVPSIKSMRRVFRIPVNSLPKQRVLAIGR